jgi:hypothetical protein
MFRLSDRLRRASTGPVALVALVIFVLFMVLVLPRQAATAEGETGASDSPDTSFYYSPGDLYDMAAAYGQEGRAAYVRARFTFDLVWPLVYAFFLTAAIGWLYGRAFPAGSRWQLTNLAPVLGLAFDYLENLATSLVMVRYPAQTAVVDQLAPLFTLLKWLFLGAAFLLLFVGLAASVWTGVRRRGDRAA